MHHRHNRLLYMVIAAIIAPWRTVHIGSLHCNLNLFYLHQAWLNRCERALCDQTEIPIGEIAKEEIANEESSEIGRICIVHQVLPITHQVELKNKMEGK